MYYINYYLARLLFSRIFPFLPFILGVLLFLSLKYFESAYLCDEEGLEELKNILNEETIKYNEALKELDNLKEKCNVAYQALEYEKAFYYELDSE
jgi:hypothetical protein